MEGFYFISFAFLFSIFTAMYLKGFSRFFLSLFVGYYTLGIPASYLVGLNYELLNIYAYAFISLSISLILFSKKNNKLNQNDIFSGTIKKGGAAKVYIYATTTIALLSFLAVVALYGIPMLNPSARHSVSAYFTYFIALLWINFPLVYCYFGKKITLGYFLITLVIFLMMGYRTPILFLVMFFIFANLCWPRIRVNKTKVIALFTFLILITGVFASLRFDDSGHFDKIMNRLGVPSQLKYVAPIYFVFAEGYIVNSGIVDVKKEIGNQYGGFTIAAFKTLLPGAQLHSRNQLAYWLGRENWETSSTTPSLIGQLMIEFGKLGVIIGMFAIGIMVARFNYKLNGQAAASKFYIRVITVSFLVLGIHTGILDPIVLFILFNFLFFLVFYSFKQVK